MSELSILLTPAVFVAFTGFLYERNGNLVVSWAAGLAAALIAATMTHMGAHVEAGVAVALFGLGSVFAALFALEMSGHVAFDEGNAVLLNREPCAGVSFRVSAGSAKEVLPQVRAA